MPIEGPPLLTGPPAKRVGRSVPVNSAREILVPFSFSRGGGVADTTDPDLQVRQHVNALLRTYLGERVMKPTYGNDLITYVFENITPADLSAIQLEISNGFDTWIPSARLVALSAIDGPDQGVPPDTVIVHIDYARRYDTTSTVTSVAIPIVSV